MIQVTFVEGGFILTYTNQHNVVDGTGLFTIITLLSAALRNEPALFAHNYWEIQQVFDRARKTEELIQLIDEIDIKGMGGNYWTFMNMLQPLFQEERTREL